MALKLVILFLSCLCSYAQMGLRSPVFVSAATKAASGATFSPDSVAGFVVWWDSDITIYSDDGVTVAVDGSDIQRWVPKSGAMNLGSTGATKKPKYIANYLNSHAAVSFDGSDDILTNAFGATYSQPYMIFMVVMVTNNAAIASLVSWNAGANTIFQTTAAGKWGLYAGTAVPFGDAVYLNNWVVTMLMNRNTSAVWTNGVAAGASATDVGTASIGGIYIGSFGTSYYAPMKICCLLFYSAEVSEADRNSIIGYLRTRYGL